MVISGVIRPPPDIRAVADKTALFVAKNGRAFEERILNSEKGKTPKFAFLHSSSPFHAYYEQRIRFHEEGGKEDEVDSKKEASEEKKEEFSEKQAGEREERKQDKAQKASAVDPVARALLLQRNKIREAHAAVENHEAKEGSPLPEGVVPPPLLRFVTAVAPNVPAVQLETIKLVAQFTALDGKGGPFLQDLAIREWNNPSFGFLQPRHGHFAYFSALVDGYRHILTTWPKQNTDDLTTTIGKSLEAAAYRAEYDRDVEERERAAQEENGGLLSGAALIDWHNFVVVETIEFPADEAVQMTLPPPPKAAGIDQEEEGMEESDEEEGETIRVVPTYKPKVVSTQTTARDASRTHVIDPITGKSVAVADMPEHMRIQLLDPKWAEEKKKFMDKQKESNLVGGDAIAANISRLAQARGDTSAADLTSDADSRKRRLDETNRIIREQAKLPPAGPTLPTVHPPGSGGNLKPPASFPVPPPPVGDVSLPPVKRARLDENPPMPPPSSMPPLPPTGLMPPPPVTMMPPPGLPPEVPPSEPPTQELMSESEFCDSLDSPTVTLSIQIPNDSSNAAWNFNGQVISLSLDVMSKVKAVKAELKTQLGGMPMNKMQLKHEGTGFLKDASTLAKHNIGPVAKLELIPKTRGGRK